MYRSSSAVLNEHLVYCVNTSGTRSALSCDNNTLQPMRWYKFVCLLLYYKYCWSNILTYILTFFHVVLICVPNIEKNDDKVELKWLNICSCCTGVHWLSDQVAGEKKMLHEIWHDGISLPDMHGLESKKKSDILTSVCYFLTVPRRLCQVFYFQNQTNLNLWKEKGHSEEICFLKEGDK